MPHARHTPGIVSRFRHFVRCASPRLRAAALVLPLVLGLFRPAPATPQPSRDDLVTISGTILDAVTRQPISGVTVALGGLGFIVETDGHGQFSLNSVPRGQYTLRLTHPRYQPAVGDFAVLRPGDFTTTMQPVAADDDGLMTGIVGVVNDAEGGRALRNVTVQVRERQGQGAPAGETVTDVRGRFALDNLPAGPSLVEFSQIGFATRTETIQVVRGRVTNLRITLSPDPLEVDSLEVTVERREIRLQETGYYIRAEEGFGSFIDRAAIEERQPAQTTDLFTRIPGAEVVPDPDNSLERYVLLRGGRSSSTERCYPRVLLDGIVVNPGSGEPTVINHLIDPSAIAGIEVFPTSSGVPARYAGTGASCGVILIWTRR